MTTAAERLVAALGGHLGLDGFALDRSGRARLVFDGTTAVDLELQADSGLLHAFCSVEALPADAGVSLLRSLLAANLSGPASFALDEARAEILLAIVIDPEREEAANLAARVGALLSQLDDWRERPSASTGLGRVGIGDQQGMIRG